MVNVNYSGTASDALSGVDAPSSTVQIDEYGVHNRDLGAAYSGITQVEAWCRNNDADGRHYTIRFTVHDAAGNYALADAIITVKATSATGKTNLNNQKQK